ncbi:hypothetical protein C9374_000088 [Naegleria lovaniensis]|uniref:MTHFR SAM-binding regulatory domain-containing protein n=1 Tax=Naegleria lovaniensis TaxID=51637 RepID=A0AA88GZ47_NAELO|nr:uncharacterized protein C9374_000088 [Naegleria lovaniensis]KAG2388649.1 hypothetical protein C9374_000088 [Naegleria lovaniensis]
MKIIDKINQCIEENKTFYSFEYFPPKTDAGVENLYQRLQRMAKFAPLFIDITWGAGGSTAGKTIEIGATAQNMIGVETQIHMTCTNMKIDELDKAIQTAKDLGISNILALRGDPPLGTQEWEKTEGGFTHAKDLVKHIRNKHGDYFGISCAGYSEGHPDGDYEKDLHYLKEKYDAGADFVVTQLFYDWQQFLKFVKDARDIGIKCPIIPGIMPINNHSSWQRMTSFCKTRIPEEMKEEMSKLNLEDDNEVKAYGIKLCITMCRALLNNGIRGLHFYTLNLEKSTESILEGLELCPKESVPRSLPWVKPANAKRLTEEVRPIFWSNRVKSYIDRTQHWDEFPNGRWSDSRSPAFGELGEEIAYFYRRKFGDKENQITAWGKEHDSIESISNVFVNFIEGKISFLPWNEQHTSPETNIIKDELIFLNKNGFLTTNSQPKVNGCPSSDKNVGWGPKNGYVYQKAYVECFISPAQLDVLEKVVAEKYPMITYQALTKDGRAKSNIKEDSTYVNAVTWGAFPGQQILQPTVVDSNAFLVWKDEAFHILDSHWLSLYDENSNAHKVLKSISDEWYLLNIVDNDYIHGDIFALFKDVVERKQ